MAYLKYSRVLCGIVAFLLLVTTACSRSAAYYMDKGNQLYARGAYADAELNYRKAAQKDPNNGEALYRAALAELKQNKPLAAWQDLERCLRVIPDNKAAQRELANLLLGGFIGDPSRPQAVYDRLVKISGEWLARDPRSAEALRIKGYLAMLEKRPEEAVTLFTSGHEANPADDKMTLGLMDALYRSGSAVRAEKAGLDFIAANKSAADVYDALYRLYGETGRPADAENILKRKIQENPKDTGYLLQLAGHYAGVNNRAELAAVMERFLASAGGDPQAHLKSGDFYASIGDWANAQREYSSGIANSKDKLTYQLRLARLLLTQNKSQEGLKLLEQTVAEHPEDQYARTLRAALLVDLQSGTKTAEAIQDLKALVEKSPDDTFLRLVYAKVLVQTGDAAGGQAQFQEVIKKDPNSVEARISLADLALKRGAAAEAIQHADVALALIPSHVQAQLIRGSALLRAGRYEESGEALIRLARQVPELVDVQLQLAYVSLAKQKYSEAETEFKKVWDAHPQEWRALGGLVDTDLAEHRPEKAVARLEEELKRTHGAQQVRSMLVTTALKSGRYNMAVEQLRTLADQTPDSIDPQLQLSNLYRLRGDLDGAIKILEKAATLQPKDPRPGTMISFLLEQLNRKQEAKQSARHALSLHPEDPAAMNNLAYLMAETGDNLDQALKLARQATGKAPQVPFFADTLAVVYLKRNQNDEALEILDKLVRQYPNNADFAYHAGVGWFQKGQTTRAKTELARALQLLPTKETEAGIQELLGRVN
ncbi:MAG: hypothetical protein C5B51_12935 [Terriglobia bacterium]|nr:MAG: hypothetical protein C5B51_12935 [Terriglobia bacterium]